MEAGMEILGQMLLVLWLLLAALLLAIDVVAFFCNPCGFGCNDGRVVVVMVLLLFKSG